jgi:hypothetical protein
MPPRFAYWTIIAGGLPTAFRTAERDELLPTFRRIQEKHPDAEMKYFARGRLWGSPEEARLELNARRTAGHHARTGSSSRGRDWRPGGDHRDAQQPFKDAKKARNQRHRQHRFEARGRRKQSEQESPPAKPHGNRLRQRTKPRRRS